MATAAGCDSLAGFICAVAKAPPTVPEEWMEGARKFFHANHDPHLDDLIFYVAGSDADQSLEDIVSEESNEEMYAKALGGSEDLVFVKRRSKPSDPENVQRLFPGTGVRWRDTFCLNVLLQLRYTVTVAVGKMTDDRFSAAEKVVAEAYPSISRPESVVVKGQTLYTYPLLCFTFDNFDELFQRIVVSKGQAIVFQLQVHGGSGAHLDLDKARQVAGLGPAAAEGDAAAPAPLRATIFEGGVPYDRLHQGYQLRRPSIVDFRNFTDKKMAFLPMRGPAGKGRAEVGVVVSDHQDAFEEDSEGSVSGSADAGAVATSPAAGKAGGAAPAEEGLAKAFNSSFRWISSAASAALGQQKLPEHPALSCFLTTLTVHWNTIWTDLMLQISKPT